MLRMQERRDLRARMSAQIMPIGVRDMVLPPIPTVSPSWTNAVASSSDMTFRRRLRSRLASVFRSCAYGVTRLSVRRKLAADATLLADATSGDMSDLLVEFVNQTVPLRDRLDEPLPEALILAAVEVLQAHALLFDPRVVTQIEDASALAV